jgi:Protein of unknown function (DUF3768)
MTISTLSNAHTIRDLNDAFRRTFIGGAVVVTPGIEALSVAQRQTILTKIRSFDTFDVDNDPHGEHDFGAVEESEIRCFWKIDYYDRAMIAHSADAADPSVTTRVLTIMLAEEY